MAADVLIFALICVGQVSALANIDVFGRDYYLKTLKSFASSPPERVAIHNGIIHYDQNGKSFNIDESGSPVVSSGNILATQRVIEIKNAHLVRVRKSVEGQLSQGYRDLKVMNSFKFIVDFHSDIGLALSTSTKKLFAFNYTTALIANRLNNAQQIDLGDGEVVYFGVDRSTGNIIVSQKSGAGGKLKLLTVATPCVRFGPKMAAKAVLSKIMRSVDESCLANQSEENSSFNKNVEKLTETSQNLKRDIEQINRDMMEMINQFKKLRTKREIEPKRVLCTTREYLSENKKTFNEITLNIESLIEKLGQQLKYSNLINQSN